MDTLVSVLYLFQLKGCPMTPDPSPELQSKRWENAKKLTLAFKQYCLDNQLAIMLSDDNLMILPSQIVITEEEINILHGRTTFNLYTNDVDMDHGVHDTSHSWYVECSLFNSPLIKYVPAESFTATVSVKEDEVVLNSNPTSDITNVKDLRYTMPLV